MRVLVSAIMVLMFAGSAFAQSAPARYEAALARERQIRASQPSAGALRSVIAQYEAIVQKYPRSGYSDNALWQASGLAWLSFEKFGADRDRRKAMALLQQLRRSYPTGSLAKQVPARLREMAEPAKPQQAVAEKAVVEKPAADERPAQPEVQRAASTAVADSPAPAPATDAPAVSPAAPAPVPSVRITGITRSALPLGERLVIAMDGEPQYHQERLQNPDRLFFDFKSTAAADSAKPALGRLNGSLVKDVRLGAHPGQTTRLVIDLEANTRHNVFALYNPYRLVVDFERTAPVEIAPVEQPRATAIETAAPKTAPAPPPITASVPASSNPVRAAGAPVVPSANANGSFSLARQLGLGVARIVIDPGHGGHDPGAIANRAREAEVVLDISLRLEKLLKAKNIDVVLTRRTDVFIPLEERTAIANREDADLFLSIHANVGRNAAANGVETYFLNFATNPEAEAVAARENAGTGMAMHNLPDIVRKIALNNKLDESRDLANAVQSSLYRGIRQQNAAARNRGVKQAPFVVLIGAQMPSVLAEVSFVTNKKEAALLRTAAYRQRIAQSLFDAIVKYRQSLKKVGTIASGPETR